MKLLTAIIVLAVLCGVASFADSQVQIEQVKIAVQFSNLEREQKASAYDSVGNHVTVGNYSSFPSQIAFVYKVSPEGQLLWTRSLGSCIQSHFYLAIDQTTNDVFVSYYTYDPVIGYGCDLFRLRGSDGKTAWSKQVHDSDVTVHQASTVQIYQHDYSPESKIKRLDPETGNELWSRNYTFNELTVTRQCLFLYDSIGYNYNLFAIDTSTGTYRWTIQLPGLAKSLPSPDGDLFVLLYGFPGMRIAKVSHESGQFDWNHPLMEMNSSTNAGRFELVLSDASVVAGVAASDYLVQSPTYTISSRNIQTGNESGRLILNDWGNSKVLNSSSNAIYVQVSSSKLIALSSDSLYEMWSSEFQASESYLTDYYRWPHVRSTDPLIFVSNPHHALQLTRFSHFDGQKIWDRRVQPKHISAFQPVVAKMTGQGIVVSGFGPNTSACLLLDSNLNHLETWEGEEGNSYIGTLPDGDVLFRGPGTLSRYSWSEGRDIWTSSVKDGQSFHISPLGEIFALDSTGQYHVITKIDQSNGQSLYAVVTPELVSSLWPSSVEFGNDGNPVLIAYKVTKISRLSSQIIFAQPIIRPSGVHRQIADVSPDGSVYLGYASSFSNPNRRTVVQKLSATTGLLLWESLISIQKSQGLTLYGFNFGSDGMVLLRRRIGPSANGNVTCISSANGSVVWSNTDNQSTTNGPAYYEVQLLGNGRIVSVSPQSIGNHNYMRFVTIDKTTGDTVGAVKLDANVFGQAVVPLAVDQFVTFHLSNWNVPNSPTIATRFRAH